MSYDFSKTLTLPRRESSEQRRIRLINISDLFHDHGIDCLINDDALVFLDQYTHNEVGHVQRWTDATYWTRNAVRQYLGY